MKHNDKFAALASSHAEQALNVLIDEMQNGSGMSRVAAATAILERCVGKPCQPVEISGGVKVDVELPDVVLDVLDGVYVRLVR